MLVKCDDNKYNDVSPLAARIKSYFLRALVVARFCLQKKEEEDFAPSFLRSDKLAAERASVALLWRETTRRFPFARV